MGVSGLYTEGQRTCGRYGKTLSGNPEENLPDGIQGRTCGKALFCEFQTTTREPETTTGFES